MSAGVGGQLFAESDPITSSAVRRRLAAVRLLLSTERRATEHDILIATIFESLCTGARSTDELLGFCHDIWPGAQITIMQVAAALETAKAGNLVLEVTRSEQASLWRLVDSSTLNIGGSADWASAVLQRCEEFLADRAQDAFGYVERTSVRLWLGILEDALFAGIQSAFAKESIDVQVVAAWTLAPRDYDLPLMFKVVEERCGAADVRGFLQAMVVDALDPANPFGSELVHTIATGYVLHSFLARRDLRSERTDLGSFDGHRALLDTPVILSLLGPRKDAQGIYQMIATTLEQGVVVGVHHETLEELENLLDRLESVAVELEEDLAAGTDLAVLTLLVQEEPIRLWLDRRAGGRAETWADFRRLVSVAVSQLKAIGVQFVRPTEDYDERDLILFERFQEVLRGILEARSGGGRGPTQIEHDAHLLVSVSKGRGLAKRESPWPGAFVITTDRKLDSAYRSAVGQGIRAMPVAVTPAQWMGVITTFASPRLAEELAQVVPTEVARQTLLSIATRFPIEASRTLARVLSHGEASSAVDLRVAQLRIEDLYAEGIELPADPISAANRVATEVLVQRGQRLNAAAAAQRRFAEEERQRAVLRSEVTCALADRERQARTVAEDHRDVLERRLADAEKRAIDAEVRSRRKAWIYSFLTLGAVVSLLAAATGLYGILTGTLVSMAVLWRQSDVWIKDSDRSFLYLLVAVIPELFGVIDIIRR